MKIRIWLRIKWSFMGINYANTRECWDVTLDGAVPVKYEDAPPAAVKLFDRFGAKLHYMVA